MSKSSNPPFSQMAILYFAIMAIGMGQTVVFGVIPYVGLELQLDQLVIDWPLLGLYYEPEKVVITSLTSVASLTFVLAASYWGRRSDIVGRKPIVLVGLIGYSVGTLIFSFVIEAGLANMVNGWWLYFALVVTRVGLVSLMAASMPASSAYVVDVTSIEARVTGIGRLSVSNNLGLMVGPALVFFTYISWTAPLYIQSAMTGLAAILVWAYLPESGAAKMAEDKHAQAPLRYLDPRYRVFLCVSLLMYTMMGSVQQTLGFYFHDLLGYDKATSAEQFSLALMLGSIAGIAALLLVVQRWNGHPIRLLQLGLPFCVLGYGCLAMATEENLLRLGMILFGFGMGLTAPGCNVSATYTVAQHEQGSLAGLSASVAGMGFVIGPLLGGSIYSIAPSYPYWIACVMLIPVALFTLFMTPPKPASS